MGTSYQKVHSPAKKIVTDRQKLDIIVQGTMNIIATAVGSTLGPGGRQVLIEQQELGLPNLVTKDGVTVFKSLGFKDPIQHVIMEAARDAATRTANDAGDGTTTATILADAIVRGIAGYCAKHPHVSPQKAIRTLKKAFAGLVEPEIKKVSMKASRKLLHNVAVVSANGDEPLADAVLECFDIVGDDGNVTLAELPGPSGYVVEKIEGYPIPKGYDESCEKFYPNFINDRANQRVYVEKPRFILYHGIVSDLMTIAGIGEMVWSAWQNDADSANVVLVATGFSESVLGHLAASFPDRTSLNIVPLKVPLSPIPNGQKQFLEDLSAVTGAVIFDPLNQPLPAPTAQRKTDANPEGWDLDCLGSGVEYFEMHRTRSTVVGHCDDELIIQRADELRTQSENAESILDRAILEERIGKLTGGIAKLVVRAPSSGEIREGKDRAEDAVRAVQGAVKHGCLPAGGWALLRLASLIRKNMDSEGVNAILADALEEPFYKLLDNVGLTSDEQKEVYGKVMESAAMHTPRAATVFNALTGEYVEAVKAGLLDSTPAVLEAIRNSLSIAALLGTLGACVTFYRDTELEQSEAKSTYDFLRHADENPANERI
jgi:chaperonin GroEL